jgi:hypothetical protein
MSIADDAPKLSSFDWDRLLSESTERSCEAYALTLEGWLTQPGLEDASKLTLRVVHRVISLEISTDPDSETPFFPRDQYEQLGKEELAPFVALLGTLSDPELRARIIDVAWQRRACKHPDVALGVAAYVESARGFVESANWRLQYVRLQRAVALGASIGAKQAAFAAAVDAIATTIEHAGDEPDVWVERLMELLLRYKAGEPGKYADLAQRLAGRARQLYETAGVGNGLWCQRERDFLTLEAAWSRRGNNAERARKAGLEVAAAFVRQADGVIRANWPAKYSFAASFVNQAIGQLVSVGGDKEAVGSLRLKLEHLQRSSVEEMPFIELPTTELEEAQETVRNRFAERPLHETLIMLALVHRPLTKEAVEEQVRERAHEHGLMTHLPATLVGPRGATLGTRGAVDGSSPSDFDVEVMRRAGQNQSWAAIALITPAIQQIMEDHNMTRVFFSQLAARSGFVASSRALSFGKGLAAGARGDFDVAAGLLFPQFEHSVREVFYANKLVTTTDPLKASQNEHDLNKLLAHDAADELFGDDAFDLRVLLIEKDGANLRNHLAHGILDDGQDLGAKAYFWWICLRIVCLPLVRAAVSWA